MNIKLVTVGKIKEKFMQEGIKEYEKRLKRYCQIDIVEIPDEKAPERLSDKEMEMIKRKEGNKILDKIQDNSYVIVLDIKGKSLSSEELADKLNTLGLSGNSKITFVIGGSLGLSKEVLDRADFKLSFSKMTFPHQLMRMILVEQVYRSFRIIKNEPYHK